MKNELFWTRLLATNLETPKRRHKCEICNAVFDCHICTVDADHVLHRVNLRDKSGDMYRHILICQRCIQLDYDRWGVVHILNGRRGSVKVKYDAITGEVIFRVKRETD